MTTDALTRSICPNCESALAGPFCTQCGQEQPVPVTWRGLVRSAVGEAASLDAPLVRTVLDLTLRPGPTCRAWLDGRQKRYVHPVKYVLLTATFVLLAWQLRKPAGEPASAALEARVFATVLGFWGYYLFPMLAPVAKVQAWLFRASEERSAECYVFDLYVFGHILWLNLASALLGLPPNSSAGLALQLAQVAFVILAVHGFYRRGVIRAVLGGLALYAVYVLSATAMGFATYAVLRSL